MIGEDDSEGKLLVLVGNGLSIAVNPALSLDSLTRAFLENHEDERDELDRLLTEIDLQDVDPSRDFEGIVGGLESAEEVVRAFMGLARASSHSDLREAAELLEARGVPQLIRRLYYAYCSEVLGSIGDLARVNIPEAVVDFGEWLARGHRVHETSDVFTLNYDVLVERLLVDEELLDLGAAVTDYFSGLPERCQELELVPRGQRYRGHQYYPEDPPSRPITLHHLHGCLTHFQAPSGDVFKFSARSVRDSGVYEYLREAEGPSLIPSVILGSRKPEKAREWPFSHAFLQLSATANRAATVVVAGYSFRDDAVNFRLREAARRPSVRWIVIDRKPEPEGASAFEELVRQTLELQEEADVTFLLDGFEGGFPDWED